MTAEPTPQPAFVLTKTPRYLLTVQQTCEALSIGRSRVYELVSLGDLQQVHSGRRALITVASVEAYVERLIDDERYRSSA